MRAKFVNENFSWEKVKPTKNPWSKWQTAWKVYINDDEWMIWQLDDEFPKGWGGPHITIQPDPYNNVYAKEHEFRGNNIIAYKRDETFLFPNHYKSSIPEEIFNFIYEKTGIKPVFIEGPHPSNPDWKNFK